jgi:hypothetical protein
MGAGIVSDAVQVQQYGKVKKNAGYMCGYI